MVSPRSVSSQIVSLDQLPAATSAERRIRHIVPCSDDGVLLVPLHHADVEEAGIFAVHGVMHGAALAVAVVLRRLDQADLGIGEHRHEILEPVRAAPRSRRRARR